MLPPPTTPRKRWNVPQSWLGCRAHCSSHYQESRSGRRLSQRGAFEVGSSWNLGCGGLCLQSCSPFFNLTGSWGGRGSPFWNCSQRCMATQNSSVFNFPVLGMLQKFFNENVLHRPSLSMSARFQTPARVCCASPVPKRRFLACTAASWPVLGAEQLNDDQLWWQ